MGNLLAYPPYIDARRREKLSARQTRSGNNLQGASKIVLPYNSFSMNTRTPSEMTEIKRVHDSSNSMDTSQFEVETVKLSSNNTSRASSFNRSSRYIKRYRNEEEKLLDMLHEREAVIKSAVKQGQELRAKCNRYKEELDSLKAFSDVDMTDVEWKKMYNQLDKKNRDLKEELDIITARNKNGRDQLNQQTEVIQQLNAELQRERIEKQRLLSNSLNSLQSIGVKDKKGKLQITQLEVDKRLLQERLNDLAVRNQRGREYLSKLEAEKREQEALFASLKSQLRLEKEEKEKLKSRVEILSSNRDISAIEDDSSNLYAQVNKSNKDTTEIEHHDTERKRSVSMNHKNDSVQHENMDTKSTGFEIDHDASNNENSRTQVQSQVYEEVEFEDKTNKEYDGNDDEEPYITSYAYNKSTPSTESGSMTSTPRIVEDVPSDDVPSDDTTEPIWDHIPASAEVDIENVTTRF
ncbi:kinesin-1 heavy chain-like [Ruditapes philippinarum]|uniref:kinesin-1 heavy chain-like n=1 Tax=Ruditapes philippinarum TaxID=129788 RepID=UPI00295BC9FA|nr:kinesin-1 heavy chain-like [Ruditapes philippinarum]